MTASAVEPDTLRRKPSRAGTARANGALSRGPVTDDGKARSSMSAPTHGLRARRHLAVPAPGEDAAEAEAHMRAVREELGAAGPVARHLAEAAARAEEGLDTAVAGLPAPSEPRIAKIEPAQQVAPPANDDAAPAATKPPPTPRQMLKVYRFFQEECIAGGGARHWHGPTEEQQAAVLAAAEEERRERAEGRDPDTPLHARAAPSSPAGRERCLSRTGSAPSPGPRCRSSRAGATA